MSIVNIINKTVTKNQRKRLYFLTIILILCITPIKNAEATTSYLLTDQSFDVDHYQDGIYVTSGAFHPEIDIVNFEIQQGKMIALFEDTPINDGEHIYTILILWNSNTSNLNKTYLQFGTGINTVQTTLHTDTGTPIIVNTTIDSVILGIDNVEAQIPNFNLISNLHNQKFVEIDAKYIEVPNLEFFQDKLVTII